MPGTWTDYRSVRAGGAGDGFGVMLGDGLGCYDLDHMDDRAAREFIAAIPESVVYAERSVSGKGMHVFIDAVEGPGYRHAGVERYTRGRFIRMTGVRFV